MRRFFLGTGLNHTPPLDLGGQYGEVHQGVPRCDRRTWGREQYGEVLGGRNSMGWARGGSGNMGRSRWADTWTSQVVTHPSTTQARR